MKELLRELVNTPGVSGNEERIRGLVSSKVEEHADSVEMDNFGNLIARKGSGEKTLMLTAHMDQIGLSVKMIGEDGYLRVAELGGIYPRNLMDQHLIIHTETGDINGVVSGKSIHLMDEDEKKRVPEMDEIYVDIGARSREEAVEMGVHRGDFVSFESRLVELGNDYVSGPAFDDRVGCAVLIEAFKRFDEDYELVAAFTAQEEGGLKGARTATRNINPDVAVAIDVSGSGDNPLVPQYESDLKSGGGPGIDLLQNGGRGLITPPHIKEWLLRTAEQGHNYQRKVDEGGRTDAAVTNISCDGIPSGSIGVPVSNVHSSVETAKVSDIEETRDLLVHAFETFPNYF